MTRAGDPGDGVLTLPGSALRLAVFLINMDGATERLAAMRHKLDRAGLPFRRIEGVDGRALAYPIPEFSERSYRLLHGRRTSPAEIGCYLSHIACARALLEGDADLALILEDDVSFEPDFREVLDRAAGQRDLWNILRLTTVNRGRKYPVRDLGGGRALAVALTREKGAGAYVIDRRAARWFVRELMPMRLAFDIAFDLEYLAGLRACFVAPLPASQLSDHPTQIQSTRLDYKLSRWRYLTVLPYRSWLELSRLACRGWRLVAGRLSGAQRAKGGGAGQQA
ncbi:glycosyltransferase family 25 protein [Paracoccus spongiarum]|uniref:Glycosyltransferase family 25 protein n=1 Tax=Paracoccus spongiarum TaxID=3064387 RepID=A0ABT9J6Y4_9RHOB|nr:glycosyltransferase family 25 protein [Paracoccus sp. 2205BS29-5]MDP5305556.1 glycosyltransferase family 25 protein [Paracoccus sp. 2205BS29-5]